MNDLGGKTHEVNGEVTDDEKLWSIIAHASFILGFVIPFLGNVIGPAIVYFIQQDKSKLVKAHALQAIVFQVYCLVLSLIVFALTFVCIGFFLIPVMIIIAWGYPILAIIKANDRKFYEYPLVNMAIGEPDLPVGTSTMQSTPAAPATPEQPAEEDGTNDGDENKQ